MVKLCWLRERTTLLPCRTEASQGQTRRDRAVSTEICCVRSNLNLSCVTWQSSLHWDMSVYVHQPQPVLCDIAEQSQLRHVACAPTSTCLVWSKEWMQLAINSDDLPWFQVMLLEVMWVSKDFDVFTFFGPSRHPIKLCVDSCEECLSGHTYIVASV